MMALMPPTEEVQVDNQLHSRDYVAPIRADASATQDVQEETVGALTRLAAHSLHLLQTRAACRV